MVLMAKALKPYRRLNRYRDGWNVYLSDPGVEADRLVRVDMTEVDARTAVRRLNALLPPARLGEPFSFHYCHHGNFVLSERDAGLDRWIDSLGEATLHIVEGACED